MATLAQRIEPVIEATVRGVLGFQLPTLTQDITTMLSRSPIARIDTTIPFKHAKREFKKEFLARLLSTFGNVTEVSRIAGLKRESVHRLIKQLRVETDGDLRHYMKVNVVKNIIGDCIDMYRTSLHPEKVRVMYGHLPALSEQVVNELPDELMSMDDAEEEFERAYLAAALHDHDGNISATARTIGLRFETLHRKLKKLGVR